MWCMVHFLKFGQPIWMRTVTSTVITFNTVIKCWAVALVFNSMWTHSFAIVHYRHNKHSKQNATTIKMIHGLQYHFFAVHIQRIILIIHCNFLDECLNVLFFNGQCMWMWMLALVYGKRATQCHCKKQHNSKISTMWWPLHALNIRIILFKRSNALCIADLTWCTANVVNAKKTLTEIFKRRSHADMMPSAKCAVKLQFQEAAHTSGLWFVVSFPFSLSVVVVVALHCFGGRVD